MLKTLFARHQGKVSDKWSSYLDRYDQLFTPYRDQPIRLLEIGVQNGGSLELWSKLFPYAKKIVGCDIEIACTQLSFDHPNIVVIGANANTDEAEQAISAQSSHFDLIIDDGSHQSGDIVCSFVRYFPYLNNGGLYIAEDLHCSYWQEFNGGLFHPYSAIAFFKRLADTINHEHWGIDKTRSELLDGFHQQYSVTFDEETLAQIHSIEFTNSMCIIKKQEPSQNKLGNRAIAGTLAVICEEIKSLHNTSNLTLTQTTNPYTINNLSTEEAVMMYTQEINHLKQSLAKRNKEITELKKIIAEQT